MKKRPNMISLLKSIYTLLTRPRQNPESPLRCAEQVEVQLTHYTKNVETIQKILENGFAYVPNKRKLIKYFILEYDFAQREPQEFGMISLTELPVEKTKAIRETFGYYGITIETKWAISHKAQKIMYVDTTGPIFEAFCRLFRQSFEDLKLKIEDRSPGDKTAFTNKVMAVTYGGQMYSNLLQIYEYMEPIESSYQQEWRIVHPLPYYGYKETKEEIIQDVSPPKGWGKYLNVEGIEPKDVVCFVCPAGEENRVRAILPANYKFKPIKTYMGCQ